MIVAFVNTTYSYDVDELPKHEQQLDPTEIVLIPYQQRRLATYVSWTVVAALLSSPQTILNRMKLLWNWTIVMFGIMILCGASPTENLAHTGWASLYFVTLAATEPPLFSVSLSSLLPRLTTMQQSFSQQDKLAAGTTNATVFLTILFQILRLYDRGWQAQRWPIPVILGSTYGWVLGSLGGTVWALMMDHPKNSKRRRNE